MLALELVLARHRGENVRRVRDSPGLPLDRSGAWPVRVFGIPKDVRKALENTSEREEERAESFVVVLDSNGEQRVKPCGGYCEWESEAGGIVGVVSEEDIRDRGIEAFRECFDADPLSCLGEYWLKRAREYMVEHMDWDDLVPYAGGEDRFEEITDASEEAEAEGFERGYYVEWDA